MLKPDDPFTGRWKFNPQRSKLSTPLPRTWVQEIVASSEEIVVHEHIVRTNGVESTVRVWARFDGTDYPVSGLPIADCMAYKRANSHSISATGKKDGFVAVNETVTVAANGKVLTLIYSVQTGASQVARGIAVFDRDVSTNR